MSLSRAIEEVTAANLKCLIPDTYTEAEKRQLNEKLKDLVGAKTQAKGINNYDLLRLLELIEQAEINEETSGFHRLFQPGAYSIENLPKHKTFFDSTRDFRESLMLGGNRCGKTTNGGVVCSVVTTGQYPDWWEGVRWNRPTHVWAVGKTGQSTRDTVQNALMGPVGAWGTGLIPKDCILRTTTRQGIAGAIDTVEIRHVSGGVSTIGFKSSDQKPSAFVGTAKHIVWLDEPCPDNVYDECLIRIMKLTEEPLEGPKGGRLIHTITPKEGLTPLLAKFLAECELLGGGQRIKGLEAMMLLQELEDDKNRENGLG